MFGQLKRIEGKLDQILGLLTTQQKETGTIMLDITALQTAVQAETTVEQSAETLLTSLSTEIQTLITQSGNTVDPAALQGFVDTLNANAKTLAAAVAANTPAAPAPAGGSALA